jgi:hypothetical protein
VIRELSRPRLVWDALILLLIVISSVLVTYQFAFDQAGALEGFQFLYLIDLFFLLDIVFNCVTTYRAVYGTLRATPARRRRTRGRSV